MRRGTGAALGALMVLISGCVLLMSGCGRPPAQRGYEFMPDMKVSVPYDTFAPNPVTANRMTQRLPVGGTIPRGFHPLHATKSAEDAERAGREWTFPDPPTPATVEQGKRLFETFCAVCHGAAGEGDGSLVPLIPNPPAYTSDRVRDMAPGRLFHVITFGAGRMPAYASQVPAADRWRIVAYVQTLQRRHVESRQ